MKRSQSSTFRHAALFFHSIVWIIAGVGVAAVDLAAFPGRDHVV